MHLLHTGLDVFASLLSVLYVMSHFGRWSKEMRRQFYARPAKLVVALRGGAFMSVTFTIFLLGAIWS